MMAKDRPRAKIKTKDEVEFRRWERLAEKKRDNRGDGPTTKGDQSPQRH